MHGHTRTKSRWSLSSSLDTWVSQEERSLESGTVVETHVASHPEVKAHSRRFQNPLMVASRVTSVRYRQTSSMVCNGGNQSLDEVIFGHWLARNRRNLAMTY